MLISKASGGERILAQFFKLLKNDTVNLLYSVCQQIWKTQQSPQDWERSVFIPISKKMSAEVWRIITLNTFQSILGCVSGTFKLHILRTKQVFMYPCSHYFDEIIKVIRWEINSRTIFFVSSTALTWDARIIEMYILKITTAASLFFFFFFHLKPEFNFI